MNAPESGTEWHEEEGIYRDMKVGGGKYALIAETAIQAALARLLPVRCLTMLANPGPVSGLAPG